MDCTVGLTHLVEAATALTRLNPNSSPRVVQTAIDEKTQIERAADASSVVSDDDSKMRDATVFVTPPRSVTTISSSSTAAAALSSNNKREIFPQRLMAVLGDAALSDIISWLPHGRSFVIIRPDVFTDEIMPKHFPPMDARASSKYPSFTRKLNRWGFRQATRGADTGAFHHPLFQRDQPELCVDMVCQRSRDRKSQPAQQAATTAAASSVNQRAPQRSKGPLKKRSPPKPSAKQQQQQQEGAKQQVVASVLTKEALDTMCESQTDSGSIADSRLVHVSAVSVEDSASENNSCSDRESSSSSSYEKIAAISQKLPRTTQAVTADASVVQLALQQRDEMERLRLAKALLYNAYMNVLQAASQTTTTTAP